MVLIVVPSDSVTLKKLHKYDQQGLCRTKVYICWTQISLKLICTPCSLMGEQSMMPTSIFSFGPALVYPFTVRSGMVARSWPNGTFSPTIAYRIEMTPAFLTIST